MRKRLLSRASSPYARISRTAPIRSVIVAVTSPRSRVRAREWRRSRLSSACSSSTIAGTHASVSRVSRTEIWLSTTRVVATTTMFWNREMSEAVMTVLVWSTSVMMPEMSWPARVRWK